MSTITTNEIAMTLELLLQARVGGQWVNCVRTHPMNVHVTEFMHEGMVTGTILHRDWEAGVSNKMRGMLNHENTLKVLDNARHWTSKNEKYVIFANEDIRFIARWNGIEQERPINAITKKDKKYEKVPVLYFRTKNPEVIDHTVHSFLDGVRVKSYNLNALLLEAEKKMTAQTEKANA
jgi:hypothetical protein